MRDFDLLGLFVVPSSELRPDMFRFIKPGLPDTQNPRQNRLLAILPESECERLTPHLELVQLPLGKDLHESGNKSNCVYFPTTALVSLLHVLENGTSTEVAMVGTMGMVGIALIMGGDTMPNRAVVRSAGQAYRLGGQMLLAFPRFRGQFDMPLESSRAPVSRGYP